MVEKVPHVNLVMYGDYGGKFGWSVMASDEGERKYILSYVSKRIEEKEWGRAVGRYPLWIEVSDVGGKRLYRSEPIGVAKDEVSAGTRAYHGVSGKLMRVMTKHLYHRKGYGNLAACFKRHDKCLDDFLRNVWG
jgi:hypothetical protein